MDNHDVNRLASTVKEKRDLANIYTMLYAMPGIPSFIMVVSMASKAQNMMAVMPISALV